MSAYSQGFSCPVSLITAWNISLCAWASQEELQPFFHWCDCWPSRKKRKERKHKRLQWREILLPEEVKLCGICLTSPRVRLFSSYSVSKIMSYLAAESFSLLHLENKNIPGANPLCAPRLSFCNLWAVWQGPSLSMAFGKEPKLNCVTVQTWKYASLGEQLSCCRAVAHSVVTHKACRRLAPISHG